MRREFLLAAAGLVLAAWLLAQPSSDWASAPQNAPPARPRVRRIIPASIVTVHDPQVAALIDNLVSPYLPLPSFWNRARLPEDPQRRLTDQRMFETRRNLRDLGFAAFPDLAARGNDNRYSYSQILQDVRNWTVGDACFQILESQVDFPALKYTNRFGSHGHAKQPQYMWQMHTTIGLPKWWALHQNLTLPELQLESLAWTIRRENEIGFTSEAQQHAILDPLLKRQAELSE